MFNLLVGPLSSLVGNAVKGFVETKKALGNKCSVCWKIRKDPCERHPKCQIS